MAPRIAGWALLCACASPLAAQGVVQPPPPDVAAIAQAAADAQAQAAAAIAAAAAASSTASAASSAAASACTPMASVPPPEVVGGSAGTGKGCRLATSVQPRITRVGPFSTGSDGTATVTWTDMGAAPALLPIPNVAAGAAMPPACYPITGSVTSTGGRIKCFVSQTITISILGATAAPITTAGSGVTGSFLAIPNS